jgi:hypothetical protein
MFKRLLNNPVDSKKIPLTIDEALSYFNEKTEETKQ